MPDGGGEIASSPVNNSQFLQEAGKDYKGQGEKKIGEERGEINPLVREEEKEKEEGNKKCGREGDKEKRREGRDCQEP